MSASLVTIRWFSFNSEARHETTHHRTNAGHSRGRHHRRAIRYLLLEHETVIFILTTHDVGPYAFDDVVASFTDHQWEQACKELQRLRKRYGNFFKLLDY